MASRAFHVNCHLLLCEVNGCSDHLFSLGELRLKSDRSCYPVLLGTGKRFFAEGTPPRSFELVSTKAMPSGIILSTYKVAGPLKTGYSILFRERMATRSPVRMPPASRAFARRFAIRADSRERTHRFP